MVLALSGPVCTGKTFAKETIMKNRPKCKEIHTYTTRKVSPTEKNIKQLSRAEFQKNLESGNLVMVYEKNGEKYAFFKQDLQRDDGDYIVEINPRTIKEAKHINPNIVSICLVADDDKGLNLIRERLLKNTLNASEKDIEISMEQVRKDIKSARENYLDFNVSVLVSRESESRFGRTMLALYDTFSKA